MKSNQSIITALSEFSSKNKNSVLISVSYAHYLLHFLFLLMSLCHLQNLYQGSFQIMPEPKLTFANMHVNPKTDWTVFRCAYFGRVNRKNLFIFNYLNWLLCRCPRRAQLNLQLTSVGSCQTPPTSSEVSESLCKHCSSYSRRYSRSHTGMSQLQFQFLKCISPPSTNKS